MSGDAWDAVLARYAPTAPQGRAAGGDAWDEILRRNRMSWNNAAWRGAQDGITFGFADELAGLTGGEAARDRVRAEQERARAERPGWYTAGQVASAFVPIGGPASLALRGANAAREAAQGANLLHSLGGAFKTFGGAAAGGVAYGSANRLGFDDSENWNDRLRALSPTSVATDAAAGMLGLGAAQLLGAGVHGFGAFQRRTAARDAFDRQLNSANAAVSSAEREASAMLPYEVADQARDQAFRRMVNEAIDAQGANAASLQGMAQKFGINLPRSMANADRDGKTWLWEAYDGVHGPAAREEAGKIISRLFDETPDAFMRVVDGPQGMAPVSAQEGASEVRARLQMLNERERQTETQAWNAFNPRAATFRFSKSGAAGLPTLAREVDARLVERRVFFDHANPEMAEIYRRMYPRAAASRDAVKLYVDGVERGRPGTLEDVVNLRRFISDAYDAARDDADRAAVYAVQRGLDDWLEHSMGQNIRQSGQEVATQFEAANRATQRNRQLFVDNKQVAKMVAPEGDAERALSTLIGTRGVQPQHGAHLTMRALRERLGADSDTWRTLKMSVLRRFTDQLEEALNRDNPRSFNTVYAQLDDLLKKHQEFLTETFTPNERMRLMQLHAVLRQMQTPGPGAANASRSGVTAARLIQGLLPGAKTAGDAFRDGVLVPRAARQQLEAATRPNVWLGDGGVVKRTGIGALTGPDSFLLNMGAGSSNAAFAAEQERQRQRIDELMQDDSYAY